MSFVRAPLTVFNDTVYLVEFTAAHVIADVWRHPRDGSYRAWSRLQPPVLNTSHEAITLAAELAEGSMVNLAIRRHGIGLALDGVEVIHHVRANPFTNGG